LNWGSIGKSVLGFVILIIVAWGALVLVIYLIQDKLLYFPQREIAQTPRDIGLHYEELRFVTSDRVAITAWYIPAEDEQGVLLFCHGNAGNISHRLDSIRIFNELRLSVLIFDYRGYGMSEGRPTEEGTYLDAEAAWDFLATTKKIRPERIVLFGRSLGGAVAAEIAMRKNPGALILESTFTSVPDIAQQYYPWLPIRLLSKFRYATVEKVGQIRCPKIIIHSPDDDIIPVAHGRMLYERASSPKDYLQIRGGHNEGFMISGSTYTEGLRDFLETYLFR
jgi:fermentation-respiration switch protein FrsA (DUF1100 family)